MEFELHGVRQRYAELAWLEEDGAEWRYRCGQKLEARKCQLRTTHWEQGTFHGLDGIEAVALPRQAQMPTKHAARRNVDDRQQPDPLHLHHVLPTQRVPFKNDFESQVELVGIKLDRVVCTQGGTLGVP